MPVAYHPQFDVVRIDATGYEIPVEDDDLEVYNVTRSLSLGTVHTDAYGVIAAGPLPSSYAGDVVEFSHGTYPLTFQLKLGSSVDDAPLQNVSVKYLVENLYATTEPLTVDLYLEDPENPDAEPVRVATGAKGSTVYFPLQSNIDKSLQIVPKTTDENFNKGTYNRAAAMPFTLPGTGEQRTLFSFYTDAVSTSGGADLYADLIPENTYNGNGSVVRALYRGEFAANGNTKTFDVLLDGNNIFTNTGTKNGGSWSIEVQTMQSASDTVRCHVTLLIPGLDPLETYTDDVVVDPAFAMLLKLRGTSTATNDIVARFGYAERLKAPQSVVYLLGGGDFLLGGGEALTE